MRSGTLLHVKSESLRGRQSQRSLAPPQRSLWARQFCTLIQSPQKHRGVGTLNGFHLSDEEGKAQRGEVTFPKSHSQEVVGSGHEDPGRLTPTWFVRSHTSLTHTPVQVKGAGGRQSPFAPRASVFLSLCLLLPPVPRERRVQALLRGLQEEVFCETANYSVLFVWLPCSFPAQSLCRCCSLLPRMLPIPTVHLSQEIPALPTATPALLKPFTFGRASPRSQSQV